MSRRALQISRDPATGAGNAGSTMEIRKVSDDSLVDSVTTDSDGRGEFTVAEIGDPGPVIATYIDGGGATKTHSGEIVGQVGGFLWVDTINDANQSFGVGRVIAGYLNELAASANGSNMNITVATGGAVLGDGYVYIREGSGTIALGAADGSNPRIDRIVLRLTREGQATQGVCVLAVLAGTPGAVPTAPNPTQNSTTWETSLAQVRVDAGVSAIVAGKVTDERAWTFTPPASIASGDLFYADANRKLARLAKGTDAQVLTLASGLPSWATAAAGLTVESGNVTTDAGVTNLDFHAVDFSLAESPENEVNIELQHHYILFVAYDDTLRSTTNVSTYVAQITKVITLPTGTWDLDVISVARIATDGGHNVDARIRIDGTDGDVSTRYGPDVGGAPMNNYAAKTAVASGSRTITLGFRNGVAGTCYMSNGLMLIICRRAS